VSAVGDLSAQAEAVAFARPRMARALARPWALGLALAVPLAVAYLLWSPPAADLSAAIYRSDLFARIGYALRDHGWYAAHGHYLLGYSLLSPPLAALMGVRVLMVLSTLAACVLFGLIAERGFGVRAGRVAALVFALGICAELLSGRVPYDLGLAIGLGSALALLRGRGAVALMLAVLTSAASPVAGAFLALAYLAWALAVDRRGWPLAIVVATLAPIATLALAFPEGGYEPFVPSSFWPAFAAVVAVGAVIPRGVLPPQAHRAVRIGAALYALALAGSFAITSPMGGNIARLGPELAPALLAGVLWQRRRLALCLIAPALVYWQLNTPIGDLSLVAGQASANPSYYAPLLSELERLRADGAAGGSARAQEPTIVEVPLTAVHAEAAYVAGHDRVELARGWERQLDTRYAPLFYRPGLTAASYRGWLAENRVEYVALPDARLDYAGRTEGALVAHGLPYLREVWRSAHWRLFRVME
jgi:hypothetical protein